MLHCRLAYRATALAGTLAALSCSGARPGGAPAESREPGVSTAPPPAAELVLLGGVVRTLDPGRPRASAVAIRDGRITAVGEDAELQAWIGEGTEVIELGGRTVVPGLSDSHVHLFGVGALGAGIDLTGTRSVEEIVSKVAAVAREGSPGWIKGRGWDQNDWEGAKNFPSARELDAVAPDRPVILRRIDGHAIWVNSAAMRAAGIGPRTKDPAGGKIVRAGGKPTGIFVDNAMSLIDRHVPAPTAEELTRWAELGQQRCLEAGLTQVHEMGIGALELEVLKQLDREGKLKLRVYAMLDGAAEDLDALLGSGPHLPAPGGDRQRLTVRGVKLYMDGALGSRGAALLAAYADDPKNTGLLVMDEKELESRVRRAHQRGHQVATHAIGDRANRVVLDVYQRVFGADLRAARPRIEHAQVVSPEDLGRFSRLGVIASMQPVHATSDMPWAEKRVGAERIRGAYAWKSLLTSGATIASGSDAPVEDISVIAGLFAATTRQDPRGATAVSWHPEERMDPTDALASFTRGAAYASFREHEAGRIVPGYVADLTVLSADPIDSDPSILRQAEAELTVIGGSIVHAKPGADRRKAPKNPAPADAGVKDPPDSGREPRPLDPRASDGGV